MLKRGVVGSVTLLALGAATCGGKSAGVGDSFCQDWAAAFCHKIWQCPPADGPSPLAGPSESVCTEGFTKSCTDPPPPGQTNDISCVGATHVNTVARDLCLSQINDATCDAFNSPTYFNNCDQVCVGAASGLGGMSGGGVGGMNGGGVGGMNGGGTGGSGGGFIPNTDVVAFCKNTARAQCNLLFQCTSAANRNADFVAQYGSTSAECATKVATAVSCPTATCTAFTTSGADMCITDQAAESCLDLLGSSPPPASCTNLGC